ncbi:MAG: iron chelate uptake ABC transporter family permease subunit [Microscillaceae bacterium]|nr:iron chelate uptake ABC transporter family permease subunit [Microscillaceae bacterium]
MIDVQDLIDFFLLRDPNVRWVVLGIMLMSAASAVVGVFAYLRKRALVGDAVSHAILPGVCVAFLVTGIKNPWILLGGAFLSGYFSLWCINLISKHSRIKPDTAIALILSVFYGVGILLLTSIQNSGNANQSGLDKFLFGKAAALVYDDVLVFSFFGVLLILVVMLLFIPFKVMAFDRDFAQSSGLPVNALDTVLSVMTVLAITIGIQTVGVVLMAALLITPAASARYWTHNLRIMVILAAAIGAFSGILGAFVSYEWAKMPTGPWVVTFLSLIAVVSVLFGTHKGVWAKLRQLHRNRLKMLEENILKCFYHLGEQDHSFTIARSLEEIQEKRLFELRQLKKGLKRLTRKKLLLLHADKYALTDQGMEEGKRVTRIHRLWELYLTKHLHLASDHVHEDAEAIEHIITPEIERELEVHLNFPRTDPHQTPIPYK